MPRERSRDLKKEKFWRRMIGGQARSGLSISGWCRRHALQESGFHWWRRELSRRDAAQQRRRPRRRTSSFVPVRIAGPGGIEPAGRSDRDRAVRRPARTSDGEKVREGNVSKATLRHARAGRALLHPFRVETRLGALITRGRASPNPGLSSMTPLGSWGLSTSRSDGRSFELPE